MDRAWRGQPLQQIVDSRGRILIGEVEREIPFAVRRFFVVTHVPIGTVRGGHAHMTIEHFAVCLRGRVTLFLDDGRGHRTTVALDANGLGVYIPPMIWDEWSDFSADAVLLVLASKEYDETDYIRDYSEFRRRVDPVS